MNRKQFLGDPEVAELVTWLAGFAGRVPVELNIGSSARVPQGVVRTVHGFDGVIDTYVWRADWTDDRGSSVKSLCWDSTARSLKRLGETLRAALASESDEAAMRACQAIFERGGERKSSVGARPFLEAKRASGQLVLSQGSA
ncbi:hypothetical protein [Paraburkholderia fynbosensis]|uniref:Uncharacterized protein n=1 Tax=Paraburkholderia fynbosensis TaxID=1200993 RepID=A0A6J5FT00_9BURK|nr:hypothetical protein [Paraburkholderia fynbosensis]CAB3786246.1 hypothetical protein LMG27177_01962 [Paraburkholderia fynbosensis]